MNPYIIGIFDNTDVQNVSSSKPVRFCATLEIRKCITRRRCSERRKASRTSRTLFLVTINITMYRKRETIKKKLRPLIRHRGSLRLRFRTFRRTKISIQPRKSDIFAVSPTPLAGSLRWKRSIIILHHDFLRGSVVFYSAPFFHAKYFAGFEACTARQKYRRKFLDVNRDFLSAVRSVNFWVFLRNVSACPLRYRTSRADFWSIFALKITVGGEGNGVGNRCRQLSNFNNYLERKNRFAAIGVTTPCKTFAKPLVLLLFSASYDCV